MSSLLLRVESKALYMFLRKPTIKHMSRAAGGIDASSLADKIYLMAHTVLGKREGKKFMRSVIRIIADFVVLYMHGKVDQNDTTQFRKAYVRYIRQIIMFLKINNMKGPDYNWTEISNVNKIKNMTFKIVETLEEFLIGVIKKNNNAIHNIEAKDSTIRSVRYVSNTIRNSTTFDGCYIRDSPTSLLLLDIVQTFSKIFNNIYLR